MSRTGSSFRGTVSKVLAAGMLSTIERRMAALREQAEACAADGDAAGACALLGRLLKLQAERFGDADVRTLATRLDFANQLQAAGAFESAQRQYDEALKHYQAAAHKNDPNILVLKFTRAQSLLRSGDLQGGRELLTRLCQESISLFGPTHPATMVYTDSLASTLVRLGDLAAAKPVVMEILAARGTGSSAEDAAGSLATASVLVTHLIDRGDWVEAIPVQQQVASLLRRLRGARDLDTLRADSLLALMLVEADESARARTLLQSIASPIADTLGRAHPETLTVFSLLATSFVRADDLLSARAVLERGYSLAAQRELKLRIAGELASVLIRQRDFEAVNIVLREIVQQASEAEPQQRWKH